MQSLTLKSSIAAVYGSFEISILGQNFMEQGSWDGEHITLLQEQLMEREKSPNVKKEQLSSCIAMF